MSRLTRIFLLALFAINLLIPPAAADTIDDVFTTLDAVYDWIIGLPGYLADLLAAIIHAILYPINALFEMVWGWITLIIDAIMSVYTAITGLFSTVTGFLTSVSSMLFPGTWGTMIMIGFSIVVLLRIYHFLKDVEIAGFKL
jgi:phage-related protein